MLFTVEVYDLARADSFYYLATPYSLYPFGQEAAWREACRIAGKLIKLGICVYSPIAETHPIAVEAGIDLFDESLWVEMDKPKLDASCGLIVAKMDGWEDSKGVAHEIAETRRANKPVFFLDVV